MAKLVGIESRTNGKRQDLPGMHVLHNNRSVGRLRLLHGVVKGALGEELDVGIDRKHQVLAGLRLMLARAQHPAARIQRGVHAARNAMQLRLEFLLQPAQAGIVDAYIAQHLRGDFVVGIEALEFFLEKNTLEVESLHAGRKPPGKRAARPRQSCARC